METLFEFLNSVRTFTILTAGVDIQQLIFAAGSVVLFAIGFNSGNQR